jgi:glycosyltransferase involved in cell wall biosynthesis
MTPLVSIIIPCYNAARWLQATLDSALAQTWPAIEVILVDDGSTDHSVEIAQRYASRGVKILTQPNRGASAARNLGLATARGDFIQFLDADDLLAPDKIEQQMQVLQTHSIDTLAMGSWGHFDHEINDARFVPQAIYAAHSGVEFLQLHYETSSMMQPGGWLASRQLLERAGPWNETLSLNDDGEYFARVMLTASRLIFVPEARCYYRRTGATSLSRRKDPRAYASLYRSVELTLAALLTADQSARTKAAAAYAWRWTAFELYPGAPVLSRQAEANARPLARCTRRLPGGRKFQWLASLLGWRLAKRLTQ